MAKPTTSSRRPPPETPYELVVDETTNEARTEPRGQTPTAVPPPAPRPHHQETNGPQIRQCHDEQHQEGAKIEGNLFSSAPAPLPLAHRRRRHHSSPYLHPKRTDPGFPTPRAARTAGGGEENHRRRRGNGGGGNEEPPLASLSTVERGKETSSGLNTHQIDPSIDDHSAGY
jgi:hypothetical protein